MYLKQLKNNIIMYFLKEYLNSDESVFSKYKEPIYFIYIIYMFLYEHTFNLKYSKILYFQYNTYNTNKIPFHKGTKKLNR